MKARLPLITSFLPNTSMPSPVASRRRTFMTLFESPNSLTSMPKSFTHPFWRITPTWSLKTPVPPRVPAMKCPFS
jgi:hypothetical protein